MFTLGYRFRPWVDSKALADGPSILDYVRDTAREAGIDRRVRYGHRVRHASWSSEDARWTVETDGPAGHHLRLPVRVRRLLPLRPGLPARVRRRRALRRDGSCTRSSGPRISTTPASGSSSSAAARPRSRSCPALAEPAGARDDGAALADVHPLDARRSIRSRTRCASCSARAGPSARRAGRTSRISTLVYEACQRRPRLMRSLLRRGVMRALPARLRRRHALQPDLRPVGPTAVPRARRRSVQGDLARPRGDGHRHGSSASRRAGSARVRTASCEADVIVTATGLNLLALRRRRADRRRRAGVAARDGSRTRG